MRLDLLWLTLAIATPASMSAQAPGYRFGEADTLRYREVSVGEMEIVSPQGTIPLETYHDAQMSVTPGRGDTVLAWYDSLADRRFGYARGERGFFYWDRARGRLLGRSRVATLEGTLTVSGAASAEMSQRLEYRNTLTLIE